MARTPSRTAQAILGFLSWGPMSGYDLKKVIEGSIRNFWKESYGQIYPILRRLREDGLAVGESDPESGGRERRVYTLTDEGREALRDWLEAPVVPRPPRNELLLKLFFGRESAPATSVAHVERFHAEQLELLDRYARIRAQLSERAAGAPDLPYWLLTLDFGEREARAHLEWSEDALTRLRDLQGEAT